VLNAISYNISSGVTFTALPELQHINLQGLNTSIDFSSSANLSVASVLYMICNAKTPKAITIKLDMKVLNACMSNADINAALSNNKNISLTA
jgi:hypothetical protein